MEYTGTVTHSKARRPRAYCSARCLFSIICCHGCVMSHIYGKSHVLRRPSERFRSGRWLTLSLHQENNATKPSDKWLQTSVGGCWADDRMEVSPLKQRLELHSSVRSSVGRSGRRIGTMKTQQDLLAPLDNRTNWHAISYGSVSIRCPEDEDVTNRRRVNKLNWPLEVTGGEKLNDTTHLSLQSAHIWVTCQIIKDIKWQNMQPTPSFRVN